MATPKKKPKPTVPGRRPDPYGVQGTGGSADTQARRASRRQSARLRRAKG